MYPSAIHSSTSSVATFRIGDPASLLAEAPTGEFLALVRANQQRAQTLTQFLRSSDPAARLNEEVLEGLRERCRDITDNTSIRPLSPGIGKGAARPQARLDPPFWQGDMIAARRDELDLARMTDQLSLHARTIVDKALARVERGRGALNSAMARMGRHHERPKAADHPALSAMVKSFILKTRNDFSTPAHEILGVASTLAYADKLVDHLKAMEGLYQQIDDHYTKLNMALPLPQQVCHDLVRSLNDAVWHADKADMHGSLGHLQRFDREFRRLCIHLEGAPTGPTSSEA